MAHDAVLVEVCHLVEGPDGIPSAKADWKPHVAAWARRDKDAEADVGFYIIYGSASTSFFSLFFSSFFFRCMRARMATGPLP